MCRFGPCLRCRLGRHPRSHASHHRCGLNRCLRRRSYDQQLGLERALAALIEVAERQWDGQIDVAQWVDCLSAAQFEPAATSDQPLPQALQRPAAFGRRAPSS